jgi:hypothetical protein
MARCGNHFLQHVTIYFRHGIRDIIPFCEAVQRIREMLAGTGIGEYLEDDMAIDGGDAEAILRGPDARLLYEAILPVLSELPFLRSAKVSLFDGPSAGAPDLTFEFQPKPS